MNGAIETFLLETYGYAKIDEFLRQPKREDNLLEFLNGTIIGTFMKTVHYEPNMAKKGFLIRRSKKITVPGISNVRTTAEPPALYRRMDLPYHLPNAGFFGGYDKVEIGRFLLDKVMPFFPEIELADSGRSIKSSSWYYSINNSNFGLHINGSSRYATKMLHVDFDSSEPFVEKLKEINKRYYEFKHQANKI